MNKNLTLYLAAMLMFGLFSCSKSEEEPKDNNEEYVLEQISIQNAFEDAENLAIGLMFESSIEFRTRQMFVRNDGCESIQVTHDQTKKTLLVDFGKGCIDSNGITRKGKLKIAYEGDFPMVGSKITVTFEEYFINSVKVEGTKTTSTRSINIFVPSIEFISEVKGGKLTWENGKFTEIEANQIKKLIFDEKNDEVIFELTGSSTGKNKFGKKFTAAITNPLIFKDSCLEKGINLASKGTLLFVFGDRAVEADFGDGTCDKKIKLTYNEKTVEVTVD
jgi:hypothetical protein